MYVSQERSYLEPVRTEVSGGGELAQRAHHFQEVHLRCLQLFNSFCVSSLSSVECNALLEIFMTHGSGNWTRPPALCVVHLVQGAAEAMCSLHHGPGLKR